MATTLEQLFQQLHQNNVSVLSVDLGKNGRFVASLQQHLQANNTTPGQLETLVENQAFHGGSWSRFNILIVSFLKYCKDVNPWSLWESSDLVFNYYQDLSNCLLNDSYSLENLVGLFKDTSDYVIPLASRLDQHYQTMGTKQYQFLTHVSSIISKLFNSTKARFDEPSKSFGELPGKQKILLYIVNRLNNIYFKIDSASSCSNIFKNTKHKSMVERFSEYPAREQVEYRYLLGRYYLLNHRISDSFHQLNSAFQMLAGQTTVSPQLQRNMYRVLKYLLPTGILFGKVPATAMVARVSTELAQMYSGLIRVVKEGNIGGFNQWLFTNEQLLRRDKLLLVLLEKLPILIYRNLIRRVIATVVIPQGSNKIPYQLIEHAVRFSTGPSHAGMSPIYNTIHSSGNVENILVTLINLSLFRGNCFPLNRMCVTMKTNNVNDIFPRVNEKIVAKFPLNNDDSWLDE